MNTKRLAAAAMLLISLTVVAQSAFAQTKPSIPTPSAPKDMTFKSLRGVQYCEVWFFVPQPNKELFVTYYNTGNLNNAVSKMDTCPAATWAKLNPEELKAQYAGVASVYKNGPRGFAADSVTIPVGPVATFDGLQARWWGKGVLPPSMLDMKAGGFAYKAIQSHRKSTMHFDKGKPVFILEDPDGTPWVMQAYSAIVDPSITYDALKDLGSKLKPPAGWKYRVVTLKEDLILSTPQGYNWITQDELQNTYDACKDGACNFKP
jgi:hypothetical protein